MSKNPPKTVIFPYPFKEQCDMALCSNPKKYTIAAEGSAPSLFFGICEYHMQSLLDAIIEHLELGPMLAKKMKLPTKLTDTREEADLLTANPTDQLDTNQTEQFDKNDESKSHNRDTAICPYCNKPFKASELRKHMEKCNAGQGEKRRTIKEG